MAAEASMRFYDLVAAPENAAWPPGWAPLLRALRASCGRRAEQGVASRLEADVVDAERL